MKALLYQLGLSITLGVLLPCCVSPVASEDAGTSTGSQGSGSGSNPGGCIGMGEAECNAAEVCRPIVGGVMTPDKSPWQIHPGTESYLGCRYGGPPNNEIGCALAIVCGYDPDGSDCWTFSNTCIPSGWALMNCFDEQCPFLEAAGGASGN